MELQTLDNHLREALIYLRDLDNESKGVVAATLVDGTNVTYATSQKKESGVWLHAERNALSLHKDIYGLPSNDAVMVVSLSPCIVDSKLRYGASCSNLLLGQDEFYPEVSIKNIHIGAIDRLQGNAGTYASLGFDMSLSARKDLRSACHNLFDYFHPKIYGKVPIREFVNEALKNI